jgi:hypothetical protein
MNLRTLLIGLALVALVAAPAAAADRTAVAVNYVKVVCTTTSADGEANGAAPAASASMATTTSSGADASTTHAHAWAKGSGRSSASASNALLYAYCSAGGSSDCVNDSSSSDIGVRGSSLQGAVSAVGAIGYSSSLGSEVFVGTLTTALGSSHVVLAAPGGTLDLDSVQPVASSGDDVTCLGLIDYFIGPNLGPVDG